MSPYFTCSQIYVYSPAYKHSFPLFHSSGPRPELHLASPHCGWASSQKEIKVAMCQMGQYGSSTSLRGGKRKVRLMYANVLSYRKLRITKGNEENHAEKEKKEEIGGQFSRRRKYLIRDVEEFFLLILGEGDRKKRRKLRWRRKMDGLKNEKGRKGLHSL